LAFDPGSLGQRILFCRAIRLSDGKDVRDRLTQTAFGIGGAHRMGRKRDFPAATVSRWESDLAVPDLVTIGAIGRLAKVDAGWLAFGAASNAPTDHGIGDMTVATALWPYVNSQTRTYLGIAGFLNLPTGSYSNQQLYNLGNKRVSGDIQIGYQTELTKNLDGMLGFDAMWFSPNNQVGPNNAQLTQKPLYTSQIGPIYHINPSISVAATYLYAWGAETALNGMSNNNALQTHRYLLSAVAHTSKGRFMLQYGTNLDTQFGLHETRRVILRYTVSF